MGQYYTEFVKVWKGNIMNMKLITSHNEKIISHAIAHWSKEPQTLFKGPIHLEFSS